jgi:hypothetical protein
MLMLAASPLGCSDSDSGGPGTIGDDGDNGGSRTQLAEATEDACNWAVDCAEDDGVNLDRDQICSVYDGFQQTAGFLGQDCENAVIDYFNCISGASCDNSDPCASEEDAANSACSNGSG